jgi:hypothetical protein
MPTIVERSTGVLSHMNHKLMVGLIVLVYTMIAGCVPSLFNQGAKPNEQAVKGRSADSDSLSPDRDDDKGRTSGRPERISRDSRVESDSIKPPIRTIEEHNQSLGESGKKQISGKDGKKRPRIVSASNTSNARSPQNEKFSEKAAFKKHDHSVYVQLITDKAIEIVSRNPKSTYARMCRNSVTDEWSLSVYFESGPYYTVSVYLWDRIDEKWTKTSDTEKRPSTQFSKSLKFTAVGKECTALKPRD